MMPFVALCTATGGGRATQAEKGGSEGAKIKGPVHPSPGEGRDSATPDCKPDMSE